MSKTEKPIFTPLDPRYKGVGGWLAVLVISLTLLSPLVLLSNTLKNSEYWAYYFSRAPGLSIVIRITDVIGYCLVACSIYAGVSLWNIWPNAVRIAKIFLMTFLILSIVLYFLPLTAKLPESLHDKIFDQAWASLSGQFVFPVVWYTYLTYSRRVAATYGANN